MIKLGVKEITDPYELAQYMGNLNYGRISGDRTRTELALKLAQSVRTYLNVFYIEHVFRRRTFCDFKGRISDFNQVFTKHMYNINLK